MKKIFFILCLLSFNAIAADLTVNITGITSKKGFIRLAMYDNATDFPGNYVNAIDSENILAQSSTATAIFKDLKPGTYAISVFHDVNNDEDLNTNFMGIPKEPFGFSNNPRILGPPKFRKCKFTVNSDKTVTIKLKRF